MNSASGAQPPGVWGGTGRWVYRLLAAIGLIAVLVSVTPIDRWWAHGYAGSMDQPRGDVLILLSAAHDDQGFISYSSYWRARYALLAWRNGGYRKIVITGGADSAIRNFLLAGGIPPDAMLIDQSSASTHDNAVNTARLLQNLPGSRVLLTSDFHMYRAERVFRREGIVATPYPVPDVMKRSEHWDGRIPGFEMLVLETAKIGYYRIRGWM